MLRKVILGFGISLDGYIARRNGAIDYLVIDKEGEALMADFFARIDTTIMGRKTAAATAKMRKSGEIPETPGITNYVVSRRWKLFIGIGPVLLGDGIPASRASSRSAISS
jgi:dihydrofolate reductase